MNVWTIWNTDFHFQLDPNFSSGSLVWGSLLIVQHL